MPKPRSTLPRGISAASPAPNQCIRPLATKISDAPKIPQKAVRQKNERRFSAGNRLTTDHQYQIEKTMAISRSNLGIAESLCFNRMCNNTFLLLLGRAYQVLKLLKSPDQSPLGCINYPILTVLLA
jgi:hypothetical protein